MTHGHRVTGVDVAPTFARLATDADPTSRYLLADGALLPFRAGAFGGRLCVCVQHPMWDAGQFQGQGANSTWVLGPTYFGPRPTGGTFERIGLSVTFRGWCYSIDDYARALESAGFVIEALREPLPGAGAPPTTRGRRLPIFLMLRLLKQS